MDVIGIIILFAALALIAAGLVWREHRARDVIAWRTPDVALYAITTPDSGEVIGYTAGPLPVVPQPRRALPYDPDRERRTPPAPGRRVAR